MFVTRAIRSWPELFALLNDGWRIRMSPAPGGGTWWQLARLEKGAVKEERWVDVKLCRSAKTRGQLIPCPDQPPGVEFSQWMARPKGQPMNVAVSFQAGQRVRYFPSSRGSAAFIGFVLATVVRTDPSGKVVIRRNDKKRACLVSPKRLALVSDEPMLSGAEIAAKKKEIEG